MERGFSLPSELHPGVQDELDALLMQLQSEGQLVSSGRFTVDFRAGQEKMRRFGLQYPEEYILKLVQAAVARGSTFFNVENWGTTLVASFDGASYSISELEGLVEDLVQDLFGSDSRDLRHLAVGLNACLALPLQMLTVVSGDAYLQVDEQSQSLGQLHHSQPGTRVVVRKKDDVFQREPVFLKERARYAPLTLRWNRLALPQWDYGRSVLPFFGFLYSTLLRLNEDYVFGQCHKHHHLVELLWPDPNAGMALTAPSSASFQASGKDGENLSAGRLRCGRALAIEMDLRREARWTLVQDGVELQTLTEMLEVWGVHGLICADHLPCDLSGLKAIEGPELESTLAQSKKDIDLAVFRLRNLLEADELTFPLSRMVKSRYGKRY